MLAAAAGGALALYPLAKDKTETSQSINDAPQSASVITPAPSAISARSKTKSTGSIQTETNDDKTDVSSICDNDCQDNISKSLLKDGLLSENMIARILDNPAAFAKNLSRAPEIVSPLLATLKADEEKDNGTQNAALAILAALSDQDKLVLAKRLTSNAHNQDRLVGLELMELSSQTQTDFIPTLNKILENESNPTVLSKAINIASNLPKETELRDTMQALTKIIQSNKSDHLSGTALLAKVKIAPSIQDVYTDISASLSNFSNDKSAFGLQALEAALQRNAGELDSEARWYNDLSLRESVRAIAQNQELNQRTRSQANQLLNSYFSDD